MAYEKLNLTTGTVLTAEHLAHIEAGIENSGGSSDGAVLYSEAQSLTTTQKSQARSNIGAASSSSIPTSVVKYTSQSLTDAQKAQARANIGAAAPGEGGDGGSAANAVLYVAQTLTDAQQIQARKNIRCGSVGEVDCTASGMYSHAEGYYTGAGGAYSHAEGYYTGAGGAYSHAEGHITSAIGECSHAEGYYTQTNGDYSHAEGYYTQANGDYSHAEGFSSFAQGENQHVQGKFNIKDDAGKYAHIVGNGASNVARSNAHTLDWNGNAWYAGYVEGTALILPSPDGTRWRITVGNTGVLTAAKEG